MIYAAIITIGTYISSGHVRLLRSPNVRAEVRHNACSHDPIYSCEYPFGESNLGSPCRHLSVTYEATVTAYSAEESPGINARGYYPRVHYSVACPRKIPFGTAVYIDGKNYVCDDRTAVRFNGRFDLFVGSKREAIEWGKREKEVRLLNLN